MEEEKIIIRRIKQKGNHGGGHGGSSWKVAYADFITALMAFFLLLWLITMSSPEKQAAISHYFRHFNLFDNGGGNKLGLLVNKGTVQTAVVPEVIEEPEKKKENEKGNESEQKQDEITTNNQTESKERLSEKLKNEVEKKLYDVKEQIIIGTFYGGVKVDLIDKDGSPMFPLGSSELTPKAKEIIKVITENIKSEHNKVALEGHTDALSYATARFTNWELSTERASAARKEFENNGLNPDTILKVSGLAATEPLIKENPYDPRNRRISILLFNPNANQNQNANQNTDSGSTEQKMPGEERPALMPQPLDVFNPLTLANEKETFFRQQK